jgi:hypothetical protein
VSGSADGFAVTNNRRVPLNVRVGVTGRQWLVDLATETDTELSTVVRAALLVARQHEAELKTYIRSHQ